MHSEPTYKKERNLLLLHLGVDTLAAYVWWDYLTVPGPTSPTPVLPWAQHATECSVHGPGLGQGPDLQRQGYGDTPVVCLLMCKHILEVRTFVRVPDIVPRAPLLHVLD